MAFAAVFLTVIVPTWLALLAVVLLAHTCVMRGVGTTFGAATPAVRREVRAVGSLTLQVSTGTRRPGPLARIVILLR